VPVGDRPSLDTVPLGEFGLRDAVPVRDRRQQPFRRLLPLDSIEGTLQFFDSDLVEMFH
jgi:hypothetical protein